MIKHFETYKPEYSIETIGVTKYVLGLLVSIYSSVVLFLLFSLCTQFVHQGFYYYEDLSTDILNYKFTNYYSVLTGLTASSMGFLLCNRIWLSFTSTLRAVRRRQRHAQNLVLFVIFLVLMFLARMANILVGLDLIIFENFQISSYLLPLFLFLYSWTIVTGVFKIKKQFFVNLLGFIIFGFILGLFNF